MNCSCPKVVVETTPAQAELFRRLFPGKAPGNLATCEALIQAGPDRVRADGTREWWTTCDRCGGERLRFALEPDECEAAV
ncbi:MAG: hypothetical protein AB7N71_13310 [Phycisphaerae bacterium]